MLYRLLLLVLALALVVYLLRSAFADLKLLVEELTLKRKLRRMAAKAVEEPRAKVLRGAGALLIKVELPGVASEKDVVLRRLENSLELRANAGDKIYFKLFPVPRSAKMKKSAFVGSEYVLEFSTA